MSTTVSPPAVRERPILFSGAMVRALLEGRKTVTRRLFFSTPGPNAAGATVYGRGPPKGLAAYDGDISDNGLPAACSIKSGCLVDISSPFGAARDRLWVKETWRPRVAHGHGTDACDCADVDVTYLADGETRFFDERRVADGWVVPKAALTGNVTPLFMPRWASRITLEIVDVRVEHLRAITDDDIVAEGVDEAAVTALQGAPPPAGASLRDLWRLGWDALNGDKSPWSAETFVWRIGFRRVDHIGAST